MPNGTTVRASRKSVNARLAITQLDSVLRCRKPITDISTRRLPNKIQIGRATSPRNTHRLSALWPAAWSWRRFVGESATGRRLVGSRNGRTVRLLSDDDERSAPNNSLWSSSIWLASRHCNQLRASTSDAVFKKNKLDWLTDWLTDWLA